MKLPPAAGIGIFLAVTAVLVSAAPPFRFAEATIDDLQGQMAAGSLAARELAAAYLARIQEIDTSGPKLNAIIELNPDALAIAEKLDAERKTGRVRGPLHGIPVLIKDNIGTADQMETTAGSLALIGAKPTRDAHLVTRLRDAGAVILGKTNLTEWANFRGEFSVSGWSARGGLTRNPYALDRSAVGSSTGSAVAVAANLCVVAVGTETSGSILSPSSACGIVGIKPTVGLVSRSGIIPISLNFDTAGPMARTVRDAAILLSVIAGRDEADPAAQPPGGTAGVDLAALDAASLRGARIGIWRTPFRHTAAMKRQLETLVARMREAGAELIDPVEMPKFPPGSQLEVLRYDFKRDINAYLSGLPPESRVRSLQDLIAFNEQHREREMPYFGQELFETSLAKGPPSEPDYRKARAECDHVVEGVDAVLTNHRLDAIAVLTFGPSGLIDLVNGDSFLGGSAAHAAVAGYPSITVPAFEIAGLPVGVSFFGPAWTESKLLAIAAAFERLAKARSEPRFLPTVPAAASR